MKKIIFCCFLAVFLMTDCKQDLVEPSFHDSDSQSIIFSGEEVNRMIREELGPIDLTFQEKMRFLSDHIVAAFSTPESKGTPSGRTQTYNSVLCVAGVWDEAEDDWIFVTDKDLLTELVSASYTIRRPSPYTVGASASIYFCTDNYCEFYDIESVDPPELVTCVESQVKAAARSWRAADGYIQLTAYITCDD